jgi:glycosyltransferase involved in cell wall biosynthesis
MKSAAVLAIPSHGEPFGRTIIEAWACDLPVVATNAGGPAELIESQKNGLLFETGNCDELAQKLHELMKDHDLTLRLKKEGCKSVQSFSIENHADEMVDLYRKTAKGYCNMKQSLKEI